MAKYSVIGYNNQVLGEVYAIDAVVAWSEAGKKYEKILDVRQVKQPAGVEKSWKEIPTRWYSHIGVQIGLSGKQWESENETFVVVTQLIPDLAEDLRADMQPEEYLGVIEPGNIVVMVGDIDGIHYIKVFPSFDTAFIEADKLMKAFTDIYAMEESGYFDRNNYLGLPSGAA